MNLAWPELRASTAAAWIALFCLPAWAAAPAFEADARRLDAALAGGGPPPPRVVARGFIATQARALAADPRFQAAVRKEAERRGPKLAEALRADPDLFSPTAFMFAALLATQRAAVAEQLAARSEREARRLTAEQSKDARLQAARKKVAAARDEAGKAAPPLSTTDATALLAAFLALQVGEKPLAGEVQEVIQEVQDAVDSAANALASCIEKATSARASCLAASGDVVSAAVCEASYSAAVIACLAE